MTFRISVALSMVWVAGSASAQFIGGALMSGMNTLQNQGLGPDLSQALPTQPSGNPLPPVQREGDLPQAGPVDEEQGHVHFIHGSASMHDSLVHIVDGVEFTDRGYHCWADEAFGDTDTNVFTLKGHVRVLGQDESIYGDTVQVDFTNKSFVAENSESTLKPALVQGRLRDNLYVKAAHADGTRQEIFAEHSTTTTCSYAKPHFELISERTDVRPGRRVIFRKVKIVVLGHTIISLPFLSVPLDERSYNNLPVVGKGTIEGYFIKTRYSFPLNGKSDINTRFDYFSNLGLGVGAGMKYDTPTTRGAFSLYTIRGPHPEFEFLGQHRQLFKWGTLSLDSSYEDDNYLISSASKILNTRATLNIPQGRSSDRFSFFRTSSESSGSSSLQQTIAMNDTRYWTPKFSTSLDFNYSDNSTNFVGNNNPVHREEVDVNFRAVDDLQKAQAQFEYLRSIPIGESSLFFSSSDVTPSLTLISDSRRLLGTGFDTKFPFQTQVSYGQYSDPITHGHVDRADFDFSFQNSRPRDPKHWVLQYQGEFKQDTYSDNTAQYVLRTGTQITYNFHGGSRFNISYNYLRPYGFTPLQIDRRGESNNIVSDISYSPFKHMLLGLATGYDFDLVQEHQPTPWQQVGLRAEYSLGKSFDARVLSTYDTTRHTYSSTRFDLTWISKATYLSFGAKYDGQRKQLAAANIFVDGLQFGRLRTSVLLTYNGYEKTFDAMHYSFIYDLHCAEAVFQIIDNPTGFNGGRAFYFFIRLKALPFDTPFGTGSQGQPIGTGTGIG